MPEANEFQELPPCGCLEPGSASAVTCYCGVDDVLRIIHRRYSLAVMITPSGAKLVTKLRGLLTELED